MRADMPYLLLADIVLTLHVAVALPEHDAADAVRR